MKRSESVGELDNSTMQLMEDSRWNEMDMWLMGLEKHGPHDTEQLRRSRLEVWLC